MENCMIVDKNIGPYSVLTDESIVNALKKIDSNEGGCVFCIDDSGILRGVFTDGDWRRSLISSVAFDINDKVISVCNTAPVFANTDDGEAHIKSLLSQKIKFVPIVNSLGQLVGVAKFRKDNFILSSRVIGGDHPCFIIAEIGNNHNGSLELAYKLVDEAVIAGADSAKFQLRDLETLYANRGNPNDAKEDLGSQYTLDLLSRFQLAVPDMFRLFDYCYKRGIIPLCTPWDIKSVENLEKYGLEGYKSASADLTNHELLERITKTGKPLISSTGMSSEIEILEAIRLLNTQNCQYALLHCNSTYPAPFKDLNLKYMDSLREMGNCPVGYSSHDRGIAITTAAVAIGANIIEKHFTLDRNMEGNDHKVSLLPHEFSEMVSSIKQVEDAVGRLMPKTISQGELMNREILSKSIYINTLLKKGEVIREEMLEIRSPGKGLQPNKKNLLVGAIALRDLNPGDVFYQSDLGEELGLPRSYKFSRPFGLPVRYHDFKSIIESTNLNLVEFHLSYKDLLINPGDYLSEIHNIDLLVHAPELFSGDHVLDLTSYSEKYRSESIENLQKIIDLTNTIKKWFSVSDKPMIIVNIGGFTQDRPLIKSDRERLYEVLVDSFSRLNDDGVELIPQTMPPYPWHFGGQRYQNLFMYPDEIAKFCSENNKRVCLDISHSKLACNSLKISFDDFIDKVGPYTAHLHIADASGVDGEGLQIGEGEIDFNNLMRLLKLKMPNASFIPEIWQGHKNSGSDFWKALEALEKYDSKVNNEI